MANVEVARRDTGSVVVLNDSWDCFVGIYHFCCFAIVILARLCQTALQTGSENSAI